VPLTFPPTLGTFVDDRIGEVGSKPHDRFVREPDEARPEKRRCAQIRGGIGQVAQHGHGILDLVGLEKPSPL